MKRLINWLEIPATDIDRAKKFYSAILGGIGFQDMDIDGTRYVLFPSEESFNAGTLVQGEYYKPSLDGTTVYLNGGKDMNNILKLVEKAGGEIIMPKTFTGKGRLYRNVCR